MKSRSRAEFGTVLFCCLDDNVNRVILFRNPQAEILRTEEIVDREAPYVASFSSRGPSYNIQNILKVMKPEQRSY